jgi:hypothetical protein
MGLRCTPAISLYGEWAAMNDPYLNALSGVQGQQASSGSFIHQKSKPGDAGPVE